MNSIFSTTLNVSSSPVMPYLNQSNPMAGQVWVRDGRVKVFDGQNWLDITQSQNVELNYNTQEILNWARSKMEEEKKAKSLAEKHVAVADALEEVTRAQEKLQVVLNLCESPK